MSKATLPPRPAPVRRPWTPPVITCLEARPEVTAYSGDSWPIRSR